MERSFTLLELLIVIIIISILAATGFTQYGNVVERARESEARYILARIRDAIEMYIQEHSDFPPPPRIANLNIGAIPENGICEDTHYFTYTFTHADLDQYTVQADRCTAGGKPPDASEWYGRVLWVRRDDGISDISPAVPGS